MQAALAGFAQARVQGDGDQNCCRSEACLESWPRGLFGFRFEHTRAYSRLHAAVHCNLTYLHQIRRFNMAFGLW